jgi:hypothetical protein
VLPRCTSLTIAVALSAIALAGSSSAAQPAFQPSVPGTAQGVVASATGRTVTVRFTGASAAAGRRLAGRRAKVACGLRAAPGLMFATRPETQSADAAIVRAGRDGTLTATLAVVGDFCQVVRDDDAVVARVGLTPAGEAWAGELNAATALFDAAYLGRPGGRYTPVATLVARGGGRIVALPGPDGTPPPGQVGYWTDGGRHAVFVAVGAAGRRLVWEDLDGRVHRTNLAEAYYDYVPPGQERVERALASDDRERGVKGYEDDATMVAGTGLRAGVRGGRVVLQFTGQAAKAFKAIRGHRVTAYCQALPASSLLGAAPAGPPDALRVIRVPRHGRELRLPRMVARDICQVFDDGFPVALAWPTALGLRFFTDIGVERGVFARLGKIDLGVLSDATAYPSTASVVAGRPSLTALAAPDGTPRKDDFGVWTDGGRQAEIVGVGRDGRRLFFADEGDGMLRTNLTLPETMAFAAGVG